MAKNVLDLDTLTERDTVSVDGVHYELTNPGELSLVDHHRCGKWGARVEQLYNGGAVTDEAVAELSHLLDLLCRLVLRTVPDEVHARLTDVQRLQVAQAFSGPTRPSPAPPAVGADAAPSTGASR